MRESAGWHSGELEVQRRAGVEGTAPAITRSGMPHGVIDFLSEQRFAVFASVREDGAVWASLRTGEPGFLEAVDAQNLRVSAADVVGDPLISNLRGNPSLGVIVIEFASRTRVRLNGNAEVISSGEFLLRTKQVYGNCQQYIQQREFSKNGGVGASSKSGPCLGGNSPSAELSPEQQDWIAEADTLFIASAHPESGADASHRGGYPGFVRVEDARTLLLPDYSGNNMFNTLGNLAVNPRIGLLFPDFHRGRTLQISGRAAILWDDPRMNEIPGARRLLRVSIDEAIETLGLTGLRYDFRNYSPFNPR